MFTFCMHGNSELATILRESTCLLSVRLWDPERERDRDRESVPEREFSIVKESLQVSEIRVLVDHTVGNYLGLLDQFLNK